MQDKHRGIKDLATAVPENSLDDLAYRAASESATVRKYKVGSPNAEKIIREYF